MTYRDAMTAAAIAYWKPLLAKHSVAAATRIAGMSRTHTYDLLRRLGLSVGRMGDARYGRRGQWNVK